ncbi:MAG: sialidase-1 [Kiritimatiellia bacterium]|jgi:sialidase-1
MNRNQMRLLFSILLVLSCSVDAIEHTDVFTSGAGGYHTYRIPAAIVSAKGTVLAFCEGRKKSRSDTGDIDLVLRRSTDQGKTWGEPRVVWDDGGNTCGNPCPVLDRDTGTLWLLLTWNAGEIHESKVKPGFGLDSRRVFVTHSTDDGLTWAEPSDITTVAKNKAWSWYATGPGAGIQLQHGAHKGRLVIPCDHKMPLAAGGLKWGSHVIYSDDHGAHWKLGGVAEKGLVNECEVVELSDGRLMLNMRNYDKTMKARQICFSKDGGASWQEQRLDPTLIEPICQASIRRISWPTSEAAGVILFSNPASTKGRENMTVRASMDDGKTWPIQKGLHAGSAAYSCLCIFDARTFGCLYECDGYKHIRFAPLTLESLSSASRTP